jgi:phospholipid N-methyltransferase
MREEAHGMLTRPTSHPALFIRQFLRHPRQVASIAPSSRFVERRIVELAGVASSRAIVELGPGSGGTTRAILAAMPADARLLAIEIDPLFCDLLSRVGDRRLVVHNGAAQQLREVLKRHRIRAPDAIVSGIPFSTIGAGAGASIVAMVAAALAPGGRFVAYQLRSEVEKLARPLLGAPHVELALRNIPPLHIYRWHKVDGVRAGGDGAARHAATRARRR